MTIRNWDRYMQESVRMLNASALELIAELVKLAALVCTRPDLDNQIMSKMFSIVCRLQRIGMEKRMELNMDYTSKLTMSCLGFPEMGEDWATSLTQSGMQVVLSCHENGFVILSASSNRADAAQFRIIRGEDVLDEGEIDLSDGPWSRPVTNRIDEHCLIEIYW